MKYYSHDDGTLVKVDGNDYYYVASKVKVWKKAYWDGAEKLIKNHIKEHLLKEITEQEAFVEIL